MTGKSLHNVYINIRSLNQQSIKRNTCWQTDYSHPMKLQKGVTFFVADLCGQWYNGINGINGMTEKLRTSGYIAIASNRSYRTLFSGTLFALKWHLSAEFGPVRLWSGPTLVRSDFSRPTRAVTVAERDSDSKNAKFWATN